MEIYEIGEREVRNKGLQCNAISLSGFVSTASGFWIAESRFLAHEKFCEPS